MTGGRRLKRELVRRALERCVELSELGRHRKVVEEVARALPVAEGWPELEGELLVWKAQALLAMGRPEEAVTAAEMAWELLPTPQGCYLVGCALADLGELDDAEQVLTVGSELFPQAPHLRVRLAMLLTEQGRLPEALEILDEVDADGDMDEALALFLFGLKSNILGVLGRWAEAEEFLRAGLERFPGNRLLEETEISIATVQRRSRAGEDLAAAWERELEELESPTAQDVDEAIVEVARALEIPRLPATAARRLWRAFLGSVPVRPRASEAWALAVILAVTRLDGLAVPVPQAARAIRVGEGTVRSALRRIMAYLDGLEPRFARRQFAAIANPRLDETSGTAESHSARAGTVVRFPCAGTEGETT